MISDVYSKYKMYSSKYHMQSALCKPHQGRIQKIRKEALPTPSIIRTVKGPFEGLGSYKNVVKTFKIQERSGGHVPRGPFPKSAHAHTGLACVADSLNRRYTRPAATQANTDNTGY